MEGGQQTKVSRIDGFAGFPNLELEWGRLVDRVPLATVFQTFEWNCAWWESFGADHELLLLAAVCSERLVGIAPLMIVRSGAVGIRAKTIQFIGGRDSDYRDFVIDPSGGTVVLGAFWQWLADHDTQWHSVWLQSVPEASLATRWLPMSSKMGRYRSTVWERYQAPTRILGDFEADQKLVRKKSLRRHFNYFDRNGRLRFECITRESEIRKHLELFFQQHIERWAGTDTPSQFLDPRSKGFYRRLISRLCPHTLLLFSVVWFEEDPIAFHLGFVHKKRLIWYKPTFKVEWAKRSPGEVLLKFMFEYALEQALDEFDFTVGGESYKYRFANEVRRTYDLRVFRTRLLYQMDRGLKIGKRLAKTSPFIRGQAKKIQRRLRKLTGR